VQPSTPGLVALRIFESAVKEGPYIQIERVTEIGIYPNYISYYTTDTATSATDWFTIQWEDDKGALSEMSAPWQGGTDSVVAELVSRVMLRDPTIREEIAVQEAEATVSRYYNTDDPYSITEMPNPSELQGLTLLTLAACYITDLFVGTAGGATTVSDYTAGLVSQRSGTGVAGGTALKLKDIEALVDWANRVLGRSYSVVLQMAAPEIPGAYSLVEDARVDETRLLLDKSRALYEIP
jgi:hypothetical protein